MAVRLDGFRKEVPRFAVRAEKVCAQQRRTTALPLVGVERMVDNVKVASFVYPPYTTTTPIKGMVSSATKLSLS